MQKSAAIVDYEARELNDLAILVQEGDKEAFRHIMQRCNQRLFRVARAVVNNDDEAEDVLQDAYINAYRRIESFRGEAELSTWLTRIVLNECYQHLRKRRPTVDIDQIDVSQMDSNVLVFPARYGMDDPARGASRSQIHDLLEHAIEELPEPFRVVFMLREVEQCSTSETAELLGIGPTTVKTRLFRARRRLRKALHKKLSDPLGEAFPFLGARCAGLIEAVMTRLEAERKISD